MKVYGIGLSRTGTTSLNKALEILGYNAFHFPHFDSFWGHIRIRGKFLDYDALTDLPVAIKYRELDRRFPGAKFVLTVRETEAWLSSCERYPAFSVDSRPSQRPKFRALRQKIYGCDCFDRALFAQTSQRHYSQVVEYFRNRPQDLLILDIAKGEGWEKLCPFLGKPVPTSPFPRTNVGKGSE